MHRVRVPKLLWRRLLVMGMVDFSPGFSQTSRVFGQVRPFRRNPGFLGYNPLTVQELASGSRDFPDEEGTESPHFTVANRRLSSTDAMGPTSGDDFLCLECARGEQSRAKRQLI